MLDLIRLQIHPTVYASVVGLWSFNHCTGRVDHFANNGVVGAVFKARRCVTLDNLDTPELLSPKSRQSGMRGKYDERIDNIPGVKLLSSTICLPLIDAEDSKRVAAVLQLANKANSLAFNRQDEFMLKGFGYQVVMLLQSAKLVDESRLCEELQARLLSVLEDMHELDMEHEPRKDPGFHKWIEEYVNTMVPEGKAVFFWFNVEGRAKHPQNINPRSANAVNNVLASRVHQVETNSDRTIASLYVPLRTSEGILGVLEVEVKVERRDILGDWLFNRLEITFINYLIEHISTFLESGILDKMRYEL